MIYKLTGILDCITTEGVVLDVQGVGYHVFTTSAIKDASPPIGKRLVLYTEQIIRQEISQLYGFASKNEKECFKGLLTVQGIGGKLALSILSSFLPNVLSHIIITQDKERLLEINGVGAKVAHRIIIELKDKCQKWFEEGFVVNEPFIQQNEKTNDALSVLLNLGYTKNESIKTLQQVSKDHSLSVEEIVKLSLQKLSKNIG
ncbi:MAG: Holliday junction branch migration protein RuvA [Alphaproteobacteria bacterium]